jgi:hypothetical protein
MWPYLNVSEHVILDWCKSDAPKHVCILLAVVLAQSCLRSEALWSHLFKDIPKRVVKLSDASKNSEVPMALSLVLSTGTSVNDRFNVSRKVFPSPYEVAMSAVAVMLSIGT